MGLESEEKEEFELVPPQGNPDDSLPFKADGKPKWRVSEGVTGAGGKGKRQTRTTKEHVVAVRFKTSARDEPVGVRESPHCRTCLLGVGTPKAERHSSRKVIHHI